MRCPECQAINPSENFFCRKCNAKLPSDHVKTRNKNKLPRTPIYLGLFFCCIAGFLIFVAIIYVDVITFPNTSHSLMYLDISAQDAESTAGQDNLFSTGEDLIEVRHYNGAMINWTKITRMQCYLMGSETPIQLKVLKINDRNYSISNARSVPGNSIILGINGNQTISSGSSIVISIAMPGYYLWKSPESGLVVK